MGSKAKESVQVARAREKLKKKLLAEDKQINDRALGEMKKAIQHRIHRLSEERVPLKVKTLELFDNKKHSARTKSKFVHRLLRDLKNEEKATDAFRKLVGRIKQ